MKPYRDWAVCAVLVLAVGALFGQTARYGFVNLDDPVYVYQNPHVSTGLTGENIAWAFGGHISNWHPLTWISLQLDCQFFGLWASGHHATNVLLHAATTVALFLVLRRLTGGLWPSAFVAALFAIHPLRVESVAWVTERKDVLSGFFFILTLAAYAGYARRHFSIGRYLLVVVLFALALMSKSVVVTLPVVLLLLDYWPLSRLGQLDLRLSSLRSRVVLEKLPLLGMAIACGMITIAVQGDALADNERLSFWWRAGSALISYVFYLGKFFWPRDLAPIYPIHEAISGGQVAAAAILLGGITTAAILGRRRCPYLFVGWFWYLIMLLPMIGLLQVGLVTVADRFTYLPQIGLCIALVWTVRDWAARAPFGRPAAVVAGLAIAAALIVTGWRQTTHWRDSETLWKHTLACTTNNSAAHNAYGNFLVDAGRTDEAIAQYREAIRIRPGLASAHFNLAAALASTGAVEDAMAAYRATIDLKPTDAKAQNNLGNLLLLQGRFDEGLRYCREAVRLNPNFAEAYYNLGNALFALGHREASVAAYRRAIAGRPGYTLAHYNLGLQLTNLGRQEEAIAAYRTTIALDPQFAEARYSLGLALKALGRRDEAMQHFREAVKIRPDFQEAKWQLGENGAEVRGN